MGVMLTGIVLLARAAIVADVTTGTAIREAAELSGERARTELTFVTSTISGSSLTVDVDNTGNASILDYNSMDFIVSYLQGAGPGTPEVSRLTYVTSTPASGQWTDMSRTPDIYQTGTWNPGEVIKLDANLPNAPTTGLPQTGIVHVVSPNGVDTVGTFVVP